MDRYVDNSYQLKYSKEIYSGEVPLRNDRKYNILVVFTVSTEYFLASEMVSAITRSSKKKLDHWLQLQAGNSASVVRVIVVTSRHVDNDK